MDIQFDFGKLDECLNTLQSVHRNVCQIADEDVQHFKNKVSSYSYIDGVSEVVADLESIYQNIDSKVIFEINNTVKLINTAKNNYADIESGTNKKIDQDEYAKLLKDLEDNYNIRTGGKGKGSSGGSALGGAFGGAIGDKIRDITGKAKEKGKGNGNIPSGMGNDPRYTNPDYTDKYNDKAKKGVPLDVALGKTNSDSSKSGTTSKSGGSNTSGYSRSNTPTTTTGVTASAAAVASSKVSGLASKSKAEIQVKKQKIGRVEKQLIQTKPAQRVVQPSTSKKNNNSISQFIEKVDSDDLKNIKIESHPYPPTDNNVIKPDSVINNPSFEELKPFTPPTNNTATPPVVNNPAPVEQPTQQPVVAPNNAPAASPAPAVSIPRRTIAPATSNNTVNIIPEAVATPNQNQAPVITPQQSPSIADNVNNGTTSDLFGTDIDDYSGFDDTVSSVGSDRSTGGSGVIPIVAGLGAAGAVGIGAKVYKDRKENNDLDLNEDRISNENKFWTTEDSEVIHSEKDEYLDAGATSYSSSSIPSYAAVDNSIDDNLDKDTWEVSDTSDNSEMVNLLGNE